MVNQTNNKNNAEARNIMEPTRNADKAEAEK